MNSSRNYQIKITAISILSSIGAILSIWQTRLFHLTRSGAGEGHSFCNIGQTFDCTAIEMSRYSEFFGGLPLSAFAISGYLVILVLSLFGFSLPYRNHVRKLLLFFSSIAVVFSLAYLAIMLGIIGKLCLLCLSVDAINLALLGLAFFLPKIEDKFMPDQSLGLNRVLITGAISLLAAFMISKASNPTSNLKRTDLNDIIESVMNTPVTPIEIPTDAPVLGNPGAPVTIVKFSDFQCPACKLAAKSIHPLMKRYPEDVRFVFMNFPLDMGCNPVVKRKMHEHACEAAAVAICANQQGKFAEAYEVLFENQERFDYDQISNLLSGIPGIDLVKLKECTKLPSTQEKIQRDVALGEKSKIVSTPTFFLNGRKVEGGFPTSLWIELIDPMLKQK